MQFSGLSVSAVVTSSAVEGRDPATESARDTDRGLSEFVRILNVSFWKIETTFSSTAR
jgi:hypothetical protein